MIKKVCTQNHEQLDSKGCIITGNFEDSLPNDDENIHYEKLGTLIQNYFEIDQMSSNVIVSHLLNRNKSFTFTTREIIVNTFYGEKSKTDN